MIELPIYIKIILILLVGFMTEPIIESIMIRESSKKIANSKKVRVFEGEDD